jgi:hypothetical protein
MQATQKPAQTENTMADPDNIQQGDQTSPDKPGQAEDRRPKALIRMTSSRAVATR